MRRKTKPAEVEKKARKAWEREMSKRFPQKKGWHWLTNGYPDYVIHNKDTKETILVELKSGKHPLHKWQREMMLALKDAKKRSAKLIRYDRAGKKVSEKEIFK